MPINTGLIGKIIPMRVDFKDSEGKFISAREQALCILNRVHQLHQCFPEIQIGLTYSANQAQTDTIINCYQQGQWKTNTHGSNQAAVVYEIEKLLNTAIYSHLQKVYRTIPFTTMKYLDGHIRSADKYSVEASLAHANDFLQNQGIILGWTNQDSQGQVAIGGGIANQVQPKGQKTFIQDWIKKNLFEGDSDIFTIAQSAISNTYPYKAYKNQDGRSHQSKFPFCIFPSLQIDGSGLINSKYQRMHEDHLKTTILDDFKIKIEAIQDESALVVLKSQLQATAEFAILTSPQGWFSYLFGLTTSSVRAFEQMFKDKEAILKP